MSYKRTAPAGLIPVGFQQSSLSNSTAVSLNSTATPCTVVHVSIETNDVRYRADGTDPTLTTGVLLQADTAYWLEGLDKGGSNVAFQRSTGTTTLNIMTYRRPGDAAS